MKIMRRTATAALACALLANCAPGIPEEALRLSAESLQMRQLQTRRYETAEESKLLAASAAVLQDLGFTLEESETKLGLVVGTKDRDAVEAGQVIGAILVAAVFGVSAPIETNQKIRVSLVTRPAEDNKTAVRITFQRIVWNNHGHVSRTEPLTAPELYSSFFEKLSESVFLTAHEI